jgi:HAD superfamily hydrolase (TIGR01484 family)
MKYKALICDVDGTLLPNRENAVLSEKVKKAIAQASDKIHVGLATSRPLFLLPVIIKELKLSGPSIINAGSEIINLSTNKVIAEHFLSEEDMVLLLNKFEFFGLPATLDDGKCEMAYDKKKSYKHIMKIFTRAVPEEITDKLLTEIEQVLTIASHKVPSWNNGKFDIFFTNSYATKQHGILEVAKLLGISTDEIIGIGDGHNDLQLLIACGLKVAMGNAVNDLKAIADYIAPSVEEDGVADVIQRFILQE